MAFFLSLEEKGIEKVLVLFAPQKYEDHIKIFLKECKKGCRMVWRKSCWPVFLLGVASYIVFFIFGVKYAFILALISGFLNFIPYIGPWVTSILLIILIAISTGSWLTVLYVLISITVIQEIENKLLTPLL